MVAPSSVMDPEIALGVLVNSSMRESTQYVKKANSVLEIISKGIDKKMANIVIPLYKLMVQPHLECCVQF